MDAALLPSSQVKRGIRRRSLEKVYVALGPDAVLDPKDALGYATLGAKISGLLIDRVQVETRHTVIVALGMIGGRVTGEDEPAIIDATPVAPVPSPPVAPTKTV